jgi:hypothetical protein
MNAAMNSEMRPARMSKGSFAADALLLVRYGFLARIPYGLKLLAVAILAGALILIGLVANQGMPWGQALLRVLSIGGVLTYLVAWNVFVAGVLLLCGPSQARLVPRIRQRAITLILLSWAIGVAACTVVFGTTLDSCLQAAVASSVYSLSLAMMQTRSPLGILLIFFTYACFISKQLSALVFGVFSGWSGVLTALALLPFLLWMFLRVMFPLSGDRAWRVQGRVECGERASRQPLGELATIGYQARAVYARSLKQAMQSKFAPARLMLHALGARYHWSDLLWVPPLVLLIPLSMRAWLELRPDPSLQETLGTVSALPFAVLAIIITVLRAWMPVVQARLTVVEQGLYRLAPRTPRAAGFNRILATSVLRAGLESWLLMSASVLCASWLLWTPPDVLAVEACACAMVLPLLALPLLDYSSEPVLSKLSRNIWITMGCVGVSVALYVVFNVAQHVEQSLLWALAYVVAAVVLLLVRGHTMLAAPAAFPAERIGN